MVECRNGYQTRKGVEVCASVCGCIKRLYPSTTLTTIEGRRDAAERQRYESSPSTVFIANTVTVVGAIHDEFASTSHLENARTAGAREADQINTLIERADDAMEPSCGCPIDHTEEILHVCGHRDRRLLYALIGRRAGRPELVCQSCLSKLPDDTFSGNWISMRKYVQAFREEFGATKKAKGKAKGKAADLPESLSVWLKDSYEAVVATSLEVAKNQWTDTYFMNMRRCPSGK